MYFCVPISVVGEISEVAEDGEEGGKGPSSILDKKPGEQAIAKEINTMAYYRHGRRTKQAGTAP
jgi:hypothetical protein